MYILELRQAFLIGRIFQYPWQPYRPQIPNEKPHVLLCQLAQLPYAVYCLSTDNRPLANALIPLNCHNTKNTFQHWPLTPATPLAIWLCVVWAQLPYATLRAGQLQTLSTSVGKAKFYFYKKFHFRAPVFWNNDVVSAWKAFELLGSSFVRNCRRWSYSVTAGNSRDASWNRLRRHANFLIPSNSLNIIRSVFVNGFVVLRMTLISLVFRYAFQKYKYYNIQSCNYACYFVWVWTMVSNNEGGGGWEQGLRVFWE